MYNLLLVCKFYQVHKMGLFFYYEFYIYFFIPTFVNKFNNTHPPFEYLPILMVLLKFILF